MCSEALAFRKLHNFSLVLKALRTKAAVKAVHAFSLFFFQAEAGPQSRASLLGPVSIETFLLIQTQRVLHIYFQAEAGPQSRASLLGPLGIETWTDKKGTGCPLPKCVVFMQTVACVLCVN